MASIKLTDRLVASATAPKGKRLELFDQQVSGLVLRVTDAGRKTWVVRYRTDDGRQPRFTLGTYPALQLTDARRDALGAMASASKGGDPSGERRRAKAQAKAEPIKTVTDLGVTYFAACERGEWKPRGKRKRATTLKAERWRWNTYVKPGLGDLRIEDVNPSAIKKVLRAQVDDGKHVTANRVLSLIRGAFNFAVHEDRLLVNPTRKVEPMGDETARARVLTDDELRLLWTLVGDLPKLHDDSGKRVYVGKAVCIAVRLSMLLIQRRAEVAGMQRSELDLENGVWVIPGERTKNGRQHLVPLGTRAVELVKEAIALAEAIQDDKPKRNDGPVFPSPRDKLRPITPAAISHAVRDLCRSTSLTNIRPHDLRRTGASLMASERLGVTPFVIGRVLNHVSERGGAASVTLENYTVYDFVPEKRQALAAWEALLLEIVGERVRPPNVLAMAGVGR
jgi:integrase